MSAFNRLPQVVRTTLLLAVVITPPIHEPAAAGLAAAAVVDADSTRTLPMTNNQDTERPRHALGMATEDDRHRHASPVAPDLNKLPAPEAAQAPDLEEVANGYAADVDRIPTPQGMPSKAQLLVFVSFSMPEPTLQRLVDQAAKAQATLVLRGFINGSLRETVARVQQVIGHSQVAFQINPQAFDRFAVVTAPTFVLVRDDAQRQVCGAGLCMETDAFTTASGDVSLDYALEFIARQAPRFANDARRFLQNLRG